MKIIILASSQDNCGLHEIKGPSAYQRTQNTVNARYFYYKDVYFNNNSIIIIMCVCVHVLVAQ